MPTFTADTVSGAQVEEFLYHEAALLDAWELYQWLELFDSERGSFFIPATDSPSSDHDTALFLIADDIVRLRTRVSQLMSGLTWAENPRSRTRHMVNNVRIVERGPDEIRVSANFVVYRMRFQKVDAYIGEYRHQLQIADGQFRIIERRAILDLEALRPHGKVSFIV